MIRANLKVGESFVAVPTITGQLGVAGSPSSASASFTATEDCVVVAHGIWRVGSGSISTTGGTVIGTSAETEIGSSNTAISKTIQLSSGDSVSVSASSSSCCVAIITRIA